MICAPMEVERKILHCSGKSPGDTIKIADVLQWSISETCIHTKKCIPLWATQGLRYQRRHVVKSLINGAKDIALKMANLLLEDEAQTLQDRYGFEGRRKEEQMFLHHEWEKPYSERIMQLEAIRAKGREFGLTSFNNAILQEEQERELSPENEQERQVERPLAAIPYRHSVHREVELFVRQGILHRDSDAFRPAFELFGSTSAMQHFEAEAWPVQLLVTADFAQTIRPSGMYDLDSFLRPVHWVVTGNDGNTNDCVVLSPYEANELLPSIRQHKKATLHLYAPRISISMRSLEDLSFCAVPAVPQNWPKPRFAILLNLFAGQLYLKGYEDYLSVCRLLGFAFYPPDEQIQVACDSFIIPASRPAFDALMEKVCPFTTSPVEFLRVLTAIRRKWQDYPRSHMGRILNGELLTRDQFQE